MGQTAIEIQAETCMSYLPFPQGIRYFYMPYCIVFLGVNFCMPNCIVFLGVNFCTPYCIVFLGVNFCMPYCIVFLGVNFCMPHCIAFLGVIEKSCQKLVLRVSSGVPNTSKQ